jgi:hypothetical protein
VTQERWTLVIALAESFGVRVLYRSPEEARGFARWLRSSGWRVRLEPTRATNPYALGRTRDEEDLALGLTLAYSQWAQAALDK